MSTGSEIQEWIQPVRGIPSATRDFHIFSLVGKVGFGYGNTKSQLFKRLFFIVILIMVSAVRIMSLRHRTGLSDQNWKLLILGSLLSVPILIYFLIQISRKKTDFFKDMANRNKGKEFAVGSGQFFVSTGEFMRTANNMTLYMSFGQQAYQMGAGYLAIDLAQVERFTLSGNQLTLYPKQKNSRGLLICIGDLAQDSAVISSLDTELRKSIPKVA